MSYSGKSADQAITVAARAVSSIAIKTPPTDLSYVAGQTLDLTGLAVTLTYNDASTEDVDFANFGTNGITASPAAGTSLTVADHHGKPVAVTHTASAQTANTNNLTVVQPTPTPTPEPPPEPTPAPTPAPSPAPTPAPTPAPEPTPPPALVGENDNETSDNISNVAETVTQSLTETIQNITNMDAATLNESISSVQEQINSIAESAATIKDPEVIQQTAVVMNNIIDNISTAFTENIDQGAAQELVASVANLAEAQVSMMENLSGTEALNLATKALKSLTTVIQNTNEIGIAGTSSAALENTVLNLAEKALEQVSKTEVVAPVVDGKTVVTPESIDTTTILQKADSVIEALDNLKTTTGNLLDNAETKVVIDIPKNEGVDNVVAQLPTELFTALSDKGIDKISIKTGDVNMEISPNVVAGIEDSESVTIESDQIPVTNDLTVGLSEDQKALVEDGAVIYDFYLAVTKGENTTRIYDFDKPITIRINHTLKEGEDKDNITVLYLADDGTIRNMVGTYDPTTGQVIFNTSHFSKYVVTMVHKSFDDVGQDNWAKKYIESLASKGIVNGKDLTGTFMPNDTLTRAEFTKMIVSVLGLGISQNTFGFTDISADQWHYPYMVTAYENKILSGKSENMIDPDGSITREEMAAILARALKYRNDADADKYNTFADKGEISDWAASSVASVVKNGIMSGRPGNILDPKGHATRAEAAKVIYMVMNILTR